MVNAGGSPEGSDMMKEGFLWNRKKKKMHFGQANVREGQKMEEPVLVGTEPIREVVGAGLSCI